MRAVNSEKPVKDINFLPSQNCYSRGCLIHVLYCTTENIGVGPGMIMVCNDKLKSGFLHNNLSCELLGQASSYR